MVSLKKIQLVKNIVKGVFVLFFLYVLVRECVLTGKAAVMAFRELKKSSKV